MTRHDARAKVQPDPNGVVGSMSVLNTTRAIATCLVPPRGIMQSRCRAAARARGTTPPCLPLQCASDEGAMGSPPAAAPHGPLPRPSRTAPAAAAAHDGDGLSPERTRTDNVCPLSGAIERRD